MMIQREVWMAMKIGVFLMGLKILEYWSRIEALTKTLTGK